jgi:hypothetical protein
MVPDLQGNDWDPELCMFVDRPRELDPTRLRFWRWLSEHGRSEHGAAGPPTGPYASKLAAESPAEGSRPRAASTW